VIDRLWWIGDSWSDARSYSSELYGAAAAAPQLVAARLGMGIINSAVSGSGYVANAGRPTFPEQAAQGWGASATGVVVLGGLNDQWQGHTPEDTYAGAVTTFGLVRRLCGDVPLIAAGPQWGAMPRPPDWGEFTDAIRQATAEASGVHIDPSEWLLGRTDLMYDPYHPNREGHGVVADRLTPLVAIVFAGRVEQPEPVRHSDGGLVFPLEFPLEFDLAGAR
jgi:lysophospholipase L1-like esterase